MSGAKAGIGCFREHCPCCHAAAELQPGEVLYRVHPWPMPDVEHFIQHTCGRSLASNLASVGKHHRQKTCLRWRFYTAEIRAIRASPQVRKVLLHIFFLRVGQEARQVPAAARIVQRPFAVQHLPCIAPERCQPPPTSHSNVAQHPCSWKTHTENASLHSALEPAGLWLTPGHAEPKHTSCVISHLAKRVRV